MKKSTEAKKHEKIEQEETKKSKKSAAERTEFGHLIPSQAASIDVLLLKGPISVDDMMKKLDLKRGRIVSHIKCLQEKKQVKLTEKDGVWSVKK